MDTDIRLKLGMAGSIREVARAHPIDNPGFTAAVARLEDRLGRAEALSQQHITARRGASGAVLAKQRVRREIQAKLGLLSGLAGAAGHEEPELVPSFAVPRPNASDRVFIARARAALAAAEKYRELLTKYGMGDTVTTELTQAIDRMEAAIAEKASARSSHVGARAELEAVTDEIMQLVDQLDALVRYHYRSDAEILGAWGSARNIAWRQGSRRQGEQPAA